MNIAIYAFPGMSLFHLSTPLRVFTEAQRLYPALNWHICTWSDEEAQIHSQEGIAITINGGSELAQTADIIIIPAWPAELPAASKELLELLQNKHSSGTVIAAFCLGAFPIVEAGLAGDRSVVTHWAFSDELAQRFPQITISPSSLYIDHGDILSSAGAASALDACIHLLGKYLGAAAAAQVAATLVLAPHRDGDQAQYTASDPPNVDASDISRLLEWIENNLSEELTVDRLAREILMSPRHLARRFKEVTGSTPAKWIRQRRLEAAKRFLEETTMPIGAVATTVGFANPVTFRQAFVGTFATTPTDYRNQHITLPIKSASLPATR